jgi:hypothetical protein
MNLYKNVGRENQTGKLHLGNIGAHGKKIIYLKETGCKGVNWIQLAQ